MSFAARAVRRHIWVKDIETGDKMEAHAIMANYTDSKTPTWTPTNIIGRSSPIYGYSYSGSRTLNYTFNFHTSVEQEDDTTPEDVKKACDFFLSLAYPDYSGGAIKPPHRVLVHIGNQVSFTAIVGSVSVTYSDPYDVHTGLAYNAKVTVSFSEVDDIPKGYEEVRMGMTQAGLA